MDPDSEIGTAAAPNTLWCDVIERQNEYVGKNDEMKRFTLCQCVRSAMSRAARVNCLILLCVILRSSRVPDMHAPKLA